MIRTLLDLDHFESLVVALTTTDNAIQLRAELNLMSGHRNMLYALVRTAPITTAFARARAPGRRRRAGRGAESAGRRRSGGRSGQNPPSISAMDIGREFFHNIEELSVFALPPAGSSAKAQAVARDRRGHRRQRSGEVRSTVEPAPDDRHAVRRPPAPSRRPKSRSRASRAWSINSTGCRRSSWCAPIAN